MRRLVCEDITKTYKEKHVLEHVHLELESGKIYGLIGRNGAGKTTLLSIMSAQNPATSGTVCLDGEPVWENEHALSNICFSREIAVSLGSSMNIQGKVKDYLHTASIFYPNWDADMAKRLVQVFELDEKKAMAKLSKGMLSMVTIIVALASKATFTFLDEPVAGLDVVARDLFYKLLLEEQEQTDRTFVISTHIIDEATDVFEEVIVVNHHTILLKENTQALLDNTYHISGKAEDVDAECEGKQAYGVENIGRSKGAMLILKDGQQIANPALNVQKPTLQNIFVALCGSVE